MPVATDIMEKLEILAEGAKYDVSCASSGSFRRNRDGVGNAASCGICHSWTSDGRYVSLLKLLMTNSCIYDCAYCLNRRSNDLRRVMLTPAEKRFQALWRSYFTTLAIAERENLRLQRSKVPLKVRSCLVEFKKWG